MKNTAVVVAILFVWIGLGDVVVGQTVLQRLQDQIRDRVKARQDAENSDAPKIVNPRKVEKVDVSGDVKVGYLGAVVDDKKDRGRGVRVLKIIPDGPAEKAGFKANDLITSIARARVRSVSDMAGILDQIPPNTVVSFTVLRNGQRQDIDVTFGSRTKSLVNEQIKRPVPTKTERSKLPEQGEVDRARIELLEQRLDQLEKRFNELERSLLKWMKKS